MPGSACAPAGAGTSHERTCSSGNSSSELRGDRPRLDRRLAGHDPARAAAACSSRSRARSCAASCSPTTVSWTPAARQHEGDLRADRDAVEVREDRVAVVGDGEVPAAPADRLAQRRRGRRAAPRRPRAPAGWRAPRGPGRRARPRSARARGARNASTTGRPRTSSHEVRMSGPSQRARRPRARPRPGRGAWRRSRRPSSVRQRERRRERRQRLARRPGRSTTCPASAAC